MAMIFRMDLSGNKFICINWYSRLAIVCSLLSCDCQTPSSVKSKAVRTCEYTHLLKDREVQFRETLNLWGMESCSLAF